MRPSTLPLAAFLVLAMTLAGGFAVAQSTTTVEFVVLDDQGQPLPDVVVSLDYKGHVAQRYRGKTDKKGRFVYLRVYVGPYRIALSKEGYGQAVVETFGVADRGQFEKPTEFRLKKRIALPTADRPASAEDLARARAAIGQALAAAVKLVAEGRYDDAEAAYLKLAAEAPGYADVHYDLGVLYKRKNEGGKAEAEFRKAIELDPKLAEAYNALAVLMIETGRPDAGQQILEQGLAADPTSPLVNYSLGIVYMTAMKRELARPLFLKALESDAANPEVHFQLASIALTDNLIPEAIARLERYLAAAPADAANVPIAQALLATLRKPAP